MRLASTRVKLRSNGIEMYAFMYQRLLGFDGFVTRDDVASVEIVRVSSARASITAEIFYGRTRLSDTWS
jgi:hypothetical protein